MPGSCSHETEDDWKKENLNLTIPNDAAYLVVEDGGVDSEWWRGYFGIQIRNFEMELKE